MSAAVRLALPFVRSTTRWWLWPPLLIWLLIVSLDWDLNSSQLGFGAAIGGGTLLALSWVLGAHLRLCNTPRLARLLPQFHRNGLLAAAGILLFPAALFAVIDGLRFETVLALLTAAALGLGFGLALPIWVVGVASMAVIFSAPLTDSGFSLVWTSDWSPAIAAGLLVLGVGRFLWKAQQHSASPRVRQFPYRISAETKTRGRQPYRLGRLFNHWPLAMGHTGLGLLMGIWFVSLGWQGGPLRDLNRFDLAVLTLYLVMFSGFGVVTMLQSLSGPRCLQLLRKLAVLPGWSRERLFVHAELSGWRGGLTQILTLGVALLALGLWAGGPDWHVGLNALAFLWIWISLGIYIALWLAREPSVILRGLALVTVYCVLAFPVVLVVASHDLVHKITPATTLAGLATAALLTWWLRGRARAAWSTMSFGRAA